MLEVSAYSCSVCKKLFTDKIGALRCEHYHSKEAYANELLLNGYSLSYIEYECGFHWKLTEVQKNITKYHCFTIPYIEGCNKPAYTVTRIDGSGNIFVSGKGSWAGPYLGKVSLESLKELRDISEKYTYGDKF